MSKKLWIYIFCLLCSIFLLTGCKETGAIIRYDVAYGTRNLDPQFASDPTAQLVIYNVFEGLVRSKPSGEIVPAAAESYTISPDEKTYTFTLRKGMHWKNGDAVTAHDFEFALKRLFNPIAKSPFAQDYLSIKNASQVLSGQMKADQLGIKATDDYTLVIVLEAANAFFLEQLSHSSAMPCHQKSFEATQGRYGLRLDSLNSNGPFYVRYWDNQNYIGLRRSERYYDSRKVVTNGVNLYIGRETPATEDAPPVTAYDLLLEGTADSAKVSYDQMLEAVEKGYSTSETEDTVWCLLYNLTKVSELKEPAVREAFTKAIDRAALEKEFYKGISPAQRMLPPSIILLGNRYISQVPSPSYPPYHPEEAMEAYRLGLENLGIAQMTNIRFIVEDTGNIAWLASCLQQMWQKDLGVYVKMTLVSPGEMKERLADKTYDIALTARTPGGAAPGEMLTPFTTDHRENVTGYSNPAFDAYLARAAISRDKEEILRYYSSAERLLAKDLPAVPLWYQTSYHINGKDVSGIEYYPDPYRTYFKYAQRIK